MKQELQYSIKVQLLDDRKIAN